MSFLYVRNKPWEAVRFFAASVVEVSWRLMAHPWCDQTYRENAFACILMQSLTVTLRLPSRKLQLEKGGLVVLNLQFNQGLCMLWPVRIHRLNLSPEMYRVGTLDGCLLRVWEIRQPDVVCSARNAFVECSKENHIMAYFRSDMFGKCVCSHASTCSDPCSVIREKMD